MGLVHHVAARAGFAVRCCFWLRARLKLLYFFTQNPLLSNLFPAPVPDSALTSILPIGISLPDDFIDLGPSFGLLSVNQDQRLTFAVSAGSTAGTMDIG